MAIVAATISALAYLLWPLSNDNAVHITGVHQALTSGRGFAQIWNFRGPTYNLYLGGLYVTATTFVDFFSPRFDFVVRLLHLGVILGGCATWARGLSARFSLSRPERWLAGAVALLAMTTAWQTIPLHTEDVATTLLLYVTGLTMLPHPRAHLAAGCLAGLLPLMKGITALYMGPVVLLAFAAGGWRRGAYVAGAALGSTLATVGLVQLFAPVQLQDLLETLHYQGGAWTLENRLAKLPSAVEYTVYNPLLLPGVLALCLHLIALLRKRAWREILFVTTSWLVPIACVPLQGRYFTYHLAPVVLPAAYSLVAVFSWVRHDTEAVRALGLRVPLVLAVFAVAMLGTWALATVSFIHPATVWLAGGLLGAIALTGLRRSTWSHPALLSLFLVVPVAIWIAGPRGAPSLRYTAKLWKEHHTRHETLVERVERRVGRGKPLLFASYGIAARHLDVRSACRHFFPMPLARSRGRDFNDLAGYRELLGCFKKYKGKYVLWDRNWLKRREFRRTKLLKHYRVVDRFTLGKHKYVLLEKKKTKKKAR